MQLGSKAADVGYAEPGMLLLASDAQRGGTK